MIFRNSVTTRITQELLH